MYRVAAQVATVEDGEARMSEKRQTPRRKDGGRRDEKLRGRDDKDGRRRRWRRVKGIKSA